MLDFPSVPQSSNQSQELESGAQDSSRTRELEPRVRVTCIAIAKYAPMSPFRWGGKFGWRGEFRVGRYSTVVGAQITLIDVHAATFLIHKIVPTFAVAREGSVDGSVDGGACAERLALLNLCTPVTPRATIIEGERQLSNISAHVSPLMNRSLT